MSKNSVAKSFFTNDKIMLTLVVINTITIFLGGYGRAPKAFLWIDSVFTVLFLLEALVKISVYGWNNYWKENWNKFDFIITLVAIPSLINLVSDTGVATNVLLSLRSLRIFKSFRLLKFIPKYQWTSQRDWLSHESIPHRYNCICRSSIDYFHSIIHIVW